MPRSLLRLLLPIALLALAAALLARGSGATAEAGDLPRIELRTVLSETLTSDSTRDATCHLAPRSGAGVVDRDRDRAGRRAGRGPPRGARRRLGPRDLRRRRPRGRRRRGRRARDEVATGWALTAGTLRVQACRRAGDAERAKVVVEHGAVPARAAPTTRAARSSRSSASKTPTRARQGPPRRASAST